MEMMNLERDSPDNEIQDCCKKAHFPRRVVVGDYLCGLTKKLDKTVYKGNTPCTVEYTLPAPYGKKVGPLAHQALIGPVFRVKTVTLYHPRYHSTRPTENNAVAVLVPSGLGQHLP